MIKYHQNGMGNEYGDDHQLTNNWNPNSDYGNEYVNIYFRINAPKYYKGNSLSFTKEENEYFYNEVKSVLSPLGWSMKTNSEQWSCGYITKGKQTLYLHPQNFSGEVLKNEVKAIAETLETQETFNLRWVDLYETIYDITNEEYEEFLITKNNEIRKLLFEKCKTKRVNQYRYAYDVCRSVADAIKLRRVGLEDGRHGGGGQTIDYILNIIKMMDEEGFLKSYIDNGCTYIRSINKTEQKKLKLKCA
jgi:hypothetical protein